MSEEEVGRFGPYVTATRELHGSHMAAAAGQCEAGARSEAGLTAALVGAEGNTNFLYQLFSGRLRDSAERGSGCGGCCCCCLRPFKRTPPPPSPSSSLWPPMPPKVGRKLSGSRSDSPLAAATAAATGSTS